MQLGNTSWTPALKGAITPYRGPVTLFSSFFKKKKLDTFRDIRLSILSFYEEDLPAFNRWVSTTFGKLQSQVQAFKDELKYYEYLLNEIGDLVLTESLKPHEAYSKLVKENSFSLQKQKGEKSELEGIDAQFFKIKKESKEIPSFRMKENLSLKQVYRRLSRFLHPDLNPKLCAFKQKMWGEVQSAYQNQEQEKLELFLAFLQYGEETTDLDDCEESDLNFWLEKLESSFRNLTTHPAFSFSHLKEKKRIRELKTQTKAQLKEEKQTLKFMLKELKKQLTQLKRTPRKVQKEPTSQQLSFELF